LAAELITLGTSVKFYGKPAVWPEGSSEGGFGLSIRVRLKAPGIDILPGQKEISLREDVSLRDLLVQLEAEFGTLVHEGFIAVNSEVVPRDRAAEIRLRDGDEVLLVPPMVDG
jgi:sulfur carrier protein ThiS